MLTQESTTLYSVTRKRYYIMFLYALTIFSSAVLRTSDSGLRKLLNNMYDVSETSWTIISRMYSALYIIGAIISVVLYNKFSLRAVMSIAVIIQALGACISIMATLSIAFLFIGSAL